MGIVNAPNSSNVQRGDPYWSMTPQSPTRSKEPMEMYAPFASRQKPKKNIAILRATVKRCGVNQQTAAGTKQPMIGPSQTTTKGFGFGKTSVREIVSGWSTMRSTVPPVVNAPTTCPNSWMAIIANQLSAKVEATKMTW